MLLVGCLAARTCRHSTRRLALARAVLAGAYRVYQDPAGLLRHLDEAAVRPAE